MSRPSVTSARTWRGSWTTRGTVGLFVGLLVLFTPLARLIEGPPTSVEVAVTALANESLGEPLFGSHDVTMTVEPERGITARYYEVDVAESRVTDVLEIDRENLELTITARVENAVNIRVGGVTRLSDNAVFDLPDQPGWASNAWKASWAALAATILLYAVTRPQTRRRDHGESLAHMNQVQDSR